MLRRNFEAAYDGLLAKKVLENGIRKGLETHMPKALGVTAWLGQPLYTKLEILRRGLYIGLSAFYGPRSS